MSTAGTTKVSVMPVLLDDAQDVDRVDVPHDDRVAAPGHPRQRPPGPADVEQGHGHHRHGVVAGSGRPRPRRRGWSAMFRPEIMTPLGSPVVPDV